MNIKKLSFQELHKLRNDINSQCKYAAKQLADDLRLKYQKLGAQSIKAYPSWGNVVVKFILPYTEHGYSEIFHFSHLINPGKEVIEVRNSDRYSMWNIKSLNIEKFFKVIKVQSKQLKELVENWAKSENVGIKRKSVFSYIIKFAQPIIVTLNGYNKVYATTSGYNYYAVNSFALDLMPNESNISILGVQDGKFDHQLSNPNVDVICYDGQIGIDIHKNKIYITDRIGSPTIYPGWIEHERNDKWERLIVRLSTLLKEKLSEKQS